MFLHSGASLHGHEYSNRHPSNQAQTAQRRSPLIRAAFGPTPIPRTAALPGAVKPALRTRRPVSEYVPRPADHVVRFQEPLSEPELEAEPATDTIARPVPNPTMSEDESSFSASELSDASQSKVKKARRKRKRVPRTSTTYLLAIPPPRLGPKTVLFQQIRPRPLLQLQQLSAESRPRPAIDVCPSSMISTSVTALLSRKFPKIVGRRGRLGLDDIVLLKSEEYESAAREETAEGAAQRLTGRALVAVLSPVKQQDRAEIVLDDGSVWVATPQRNGNYDFAHEDDLGNTTLARWVRRSVTTTTSATASVDASSPAISPSTSTPPVPEYKYTFSIVNPLSRRHPVMASLTSTALDIQDYYTTVSSSYGRYPPSRAFSSVISPTSSSIGAVPPSPSTPTPTLRNAYSDDEGDSVMLPSPAPERSTVAIHDALKNMISVTAVWVALRSGWSPHYKPTPQDAGHRADSGSTNSGTMCANGPASSNPCQGRAGPNRSGTWDTSGPERRTSPDTSVVLNAPPPRPSSVTSSISLARDRSVTPTHARVRSVDQLGMHLVTTTTGQVTAAEQGSATAAYPPCGPRTTPHRVMSTGAAFMQRRRQQQQQQQQQHQTHASDASDSERPTPTSSRRRGRFPRLLSGDRSSSGAGVASQAPFAHTLGPSPGDTYRVQRMPTRDVNTEPIALSPLTPPITLPPEPASYAFTDNPVSGGISRNSTIIINKARVNSIARSNSTTTAAGPPHYGHRKVHSMAYGIVSPITSTVDEPSPVGSNTVISDLSLHTGLPDSLHNFPQAGFEDGAHKAAGGAAGRIRSLGNWLRKLGAH
jgi:hypothetical protein